MGKILLTAPAGRGKTHYCVRKYAGAFKDGLAGLNNDSFFILPTREHAERVLDIILSELRKEGLQPGLFNPNVLTINDFIRACPSRAGEAAINDMLRSFYLKGICADSSVPLKYYSSCRGLKGFPSLLNDFIKELKKNNIEFSIFKEIARAGRVKDPVLKAKLDDLLTIFCAYQEILDREKLTDPESAVNSFIGWMREGRTKELPYKTIIFDGFYHFTGTQLEFIKAVSGLCEDIVVTLTTDDERGRLFQYVNKTREALLGGGFGFKIEKLDCENRRAANAPSLEALEKNLFSEKNAAKKGYPSGITIFEATGVSGEMEMIAREIARLMENPAEAGKEELKFSDFCVIFRTLTSVEDVVRSVFNKFSIPVEVHERRRLRQNSYMKAVVHFISFFADGCRRENLFEFLRSGYFSFDSQGGRDLQRTIMERGIERGEAVFSLADEPSLSETGKETLKKIAEFDARMKKGKNFRGFASCLMSFIQENSAVGTVLGENSGTEKEDFIALGEFKKITEEVIDLKKAEGPNALNNFYELLLGGIEVSLFSVRDANRNKVQVYDIATAIQKEYRVVFAAGLLDREFPKQVIEDPVLKDSERALLNSGKEFFELRRERVAGERFLFYMAVTRASRRLYLSYPKFDIDGKEALPSFFVDEVKKCFGENEIRKVTKDVTDVVPKFSEAVNDADILTASAYNLFRKVSFSASEPGSLKNELALSISFIDYLSEKFGARLFEEIRKKDAGFARLGDRDVLRYYNEKGGGFFSPSALSAYARCPYQYFAQNIIALEDARIGIDSAVIGNIYHDALQRFYEGLDGKMVSEAFSSPREASLAITGALEDAIKKKRDDGEDYFKGENNAAVAVLRRSIAGRLSFFIDREFEYEKERPEFVPVFFEKEFRFEAEGVRLKGRIDRIDIYEGPEGKAAVVIDYKSGGKKFKIEEFEDGVDLQIPIYIWAVSGKGVKEPMRAAAGEIYNLRSFERTGVYNKDFFGGMTDSAQRQVGGDELFARYAALVTSHVKEFAAEISRGVISPNPYPGTCKYCPYNEVCRYPFTWQEKGRWEKNRKRVMRNGKDI